MTNFHFAKIVAGVWPMLAKETILSKIINMVDVFRISLSEWFDDNNKKYIDTILKLDNSKTVMLETRWNDSRVKNIYNVTVRKWQEIIADYSEYAQEWIKKLYIDYPHFWELSNWTQIIFEQSDVIMEVKKTEDDFAYCKVTKGWEILQYDRIYIDHKMFGMPFLLEKDKKDILWWLEHWVHIIAASWVKVHEDILSLKSFLAEHHAPDLKIMSKIETLEAIDNLDEIISISDGIILVFDKLESILKDKNITEKEIIQRCKISAKPVIVTYVHWVNTPKYKLCDEKNIKRLAAMSVDSFMIEPLIKEEAPLEMVTNLFEILSKNKPSNKELNLMDFYKKDDFIIRDYIIFNSYRITQELEIKAVVCYTETWYTTARLSSLCPAVPIIAFTKSDATYRFLNSLQGVRWYKISQSFDYENLKRIWKEMIRIIFKWNISLDDKIIIVQANEINQHAKTDMINGVELYKFKNI